MYSLVFAGVFLSYLSAEEQKKKPNATPIEKNSRIDDIAVIDVNNIALDLENDGSSGNDGRGFYPNGSSQSFLFQAGVSMSGFVDGELRTGWIAKSSLVLELQPGVMSQSPQDPDARFYEVKLIDNFGSPNYVAWQEAVAQGAGFQDLDGNGIYNPNVDRPDIIGDITYWTAFNDCTSISQRTPRYQTEPLGIEIHQTVWALDRSDGFGDIIFFRYRLFNKNESPINSLSFSHWSDPDVGDNGDDLIGSDIPLQLSYCYNNGSDLVYGINPPAFGVRLLQGPIVPMPGGTAYRFRGFVLGTEVIQDAVNLTASSVMTYINADAILPDPSTASAARYYQEGCRDVSGQPIIPSAWGTGGTTADNCKFFYSGDPVAGTGWRDTMPSDKRMIFSVTPFHLAAGDTQEVIFAYLVGRGNDHLDSVTELKDRAELAETYIGFSQPPVGLENIVTRAESFRLFANYPNPFNPSTTIQYELPSATQIKLTVFDPLGREVRTLVDSHKNAGENHVVWDGRDASGNDVASGIYIYQLITESTTVARKMLLVR